MRHMWLWRTFLRKLIKRYSKLQFLNWLCRKAIFHKNFYLKYVLSCYIIQLLKICVEVQIKVDSQKVVYVWVNYVGFLDINKTVYLIFIVSYIYAMYYEHILTLPYPIPLPILQVSLCVWMFYLHVYMCAMWVQWHRDHEMPLDPIEVKVQRFGAIT